MDFGELKKSVEALGGGLDFSGLLNLPPGREPGDDEPAVETKSTPATTSLLLAFLFNYHFQPLGVYFPHYLPHVYFVFGSCLRVS